MKKTYKRILAATLASILVWNTCEWQPRALAGSKVYQIEEIKALPESVLHQEVPYGTKYKDLELPDKLSMRIWAEETSDGEDSVEDKDGAETIATPSDLRSEDEEETEEMSQKVSLSEIEDIAQKASPSEADVTEKSETGADENEQKASPSDADEAKTDKNWKDVKVRWVLDETFSEKDTYDGKTPGVYVFDAELKSSRYELNTGFLPRIEVTVLPEEKLPQILSWEWIDEQEALIDGELQLAVTEEDQIPFEEIVSMLPEQILANVCENDENDEPAETEIALSGWKCDEYKEDEEGRYPTEGEFLFQAELPEGYELDADVEALQVKVVLGDPEIMLLGETIDVSTLDDTKIQIDDSNLDTWNNHILTGTCKSSAQYLYIKEVEVNLTINNLTIDRTGLTNGHYSAIELADGATLNLTLINDNIIKGASGGAGIYVPKGCTLKITEKSEGSLTATGGDYYGGAAGIGARASNINLADSSVKNFTTVKVGKILIEGGTVTAQGGTYSYWGENHFGAAGIGGSYGKSGAEIIITGGTVSATGGAFAAGIGGGYDGSAASVTIRGGDVTAKRGGRKDSLVYGAAIGNGYTNFNEASDVPDCGNITISGGTVFAEGNIGYGDSNENLFPGSGGSVTISGGSVEVTGEIKGDLLNINQDYVVHSYALRLIIYADDFTASDETVTGTVSIGEGENRYEDTKVDFTVTDGAASAEISLSSLLHGSQPVSVALNGVAYEEKTVDLDIENEVIWGVQPQMEVEEISGCGYTYNNGFLRFTGNGSAAVKMAEGIETTDHQIQIAKNSDVTLTICDMVMNSGSKGRSTIIVEEGGKLTLVLKGSNTMQGDAWANAVISASEADVVLEGTGSLTLKNDAGDTGRYGYNSGIWAKSLQVQGNPVLKAIIMNGGVPLRGTEIRIGGGNIYAESGKWGYTAIGGVMDNPGKVYITGGTIYAEGGKLNTNGGGISNRYTQAVITGGSVNMNRNYSGSGTSFLQPKNTNDTLLYCTTITVGAARSLSKNAQVLKLDIKVNDTEYEYSTNQMTTDENGKLYLWLPEGAVVSQVTTVNGTYKGTCTTNTKMTDGSGSIWGTASAIFLLGSGETMFYPVEDITMKEEINRKGDYELKFLVSISPDNATKQVSDIEWSIRNDTSNTVRATVDNEGDKTLHIYEFGSFTLKARIPDGKGPGMDFEKEFSIEAVCPHENGKTLQFNETEHWYVCNECIEELGREAHSGGTATCMEKAKCSTCHQVYGEIGAHNLTKQEEVSPTCTEDGNIEYWHCSICGKNFSDAQGSKEISNVVVAALTHNWGKWKSNHNGTHTRVCKNDASHTETENCSGGTATCLDAAVCEICHESYGKALEHDWEAWKSNHDGTHSRVCKRDVTHTETENCSGGTATCREAALCEECGSYYGDRDAGNHIGGTEVRNADSQYTGDIYCLGCGVLLERGTAIRNDDTASSTGSSGSASSSKKESSRSAGTSKITQDPKRGSVSTSQGILTGNGKNTSRWEEISGENMTGSSWKLIYADGTYAAGAWKNREDGTIYELPVWELINGSWYAFGADSVAKSGWLYDESYGGWFYIDLECGMLTGWHLIDGKWYYFHPTSDGRKGVLYVGRRTPDGYYVDENGVWDGKGRQ